MTHSEEEEYYILQKDTDYTYHPIEDRFIGPQWDPHLDQREYLEDLMRSDPEKFAGCVIAHKD